jgi:glutamine phosphoribosylpyrophosphate amidotransferase
MYEYNLGGSGCSAEAQPLYTNAPFGIALAHNGKVHHYHSIIFSIVFSVSEQ